MIPGKTQAKSVYALTDHGNSTLKAYQIQDDQIQFQKYVQVDDYALGAVDVAIDSSRELIFLTYENSTRIVWADTRTMQQKGYIDLQYMLAIQGDSTANIYGGTFDLFASGSNAIAYLYAYEVTYHPTGGTTNDGWIEGRYYSDDTYFAFSFYTGASYEHLNVVPEPSSLLFLSFGVICLRR